MHRHKVTAITAIGEYLLAHDVCPARFLGDLGLPPAALLGSDLWLDRDACFLIAESASRATGDPFPGLHVAEIQDLWNYGRWSATILASPTLGTAMRAACGNIRLIESGRLLQLSCKGDRARIHTRFLGDLAYSPKQYLDASLVLLGRIIRLAKEPVPLEVHFVHARPRDTAEIERLLGPNLVFDAEETALVIDRGALTLPLDGRKIAIEAPSPGAGGAHIHACVTAAAAQIVEQIVQYERPTVTNVAAALSMNVRTMQRHLAAWGVTFEEILEDYRLHHALIGLREEKRSVTDVAFQLGYSDAAHFTRAFRRWTGLPPSRIDSVEDSFPQAILPLLAGSSSVATAA